MNIKDKLSQLLTFAGFNLFYLFFLFFVFIPILPLGFPWWADGLIILSTIIFPVLGGVITLVLWGWSFIVMIKSPFTWFSVIYFIGLLIYVAFFLIPTIRKNFK